MDINFFPDMLKLPLSADFTLTVAREPACIAILFKCKPIPDGLGTLTARLSKLSEEDVSWVDGLLLAVDDLFDETDATTSMTAGLTGGIEQLTTPEAFCKPKLVGDIFR